MEGNYFNLQHAVGSINDGNDDPPVTGYILPKGAGCWVSARTQAPEVQEYNATVAKFFTMALMLICVFVTYGWWENRGKDFPNHATDMQALTKLAFWLLLDLGAAVAGWRYLKKFKQVGKFDTMSQFRKLLEAETLPLENTQK
ncbi:MAG: hypothetical protein ABIQ93_16640 [Saprospiraceae bacterium]